MRTPGLVSSYLISLIVALLISLWLHLLWQNYVGLERGSDMLYLSYSVNFLLATGIFVLLFLLRKRYKHQIGFIYMGGSLLKFLVFFLLFYPGYREDAMVTRSEFGAFFVPYLLCLLFETVFTAKILLTKPED
ncbi:DUF6168 family protein [Muriicola marianensis]|uniref:Uncharacterized protein n=1 Tax=Muriicola marianensis TaxID=1324801 RepID=A0ABQ1QY48_9FLAO|nr:DUF6168 family protein [Muriicola marianensis]GGD49605.1 hypothetical protein GCM10011361_15380 [Muriicola marianensis]